MQYGTFLQHESNTWSDVTYDITVNNKHDYKTVCYMNDIYGRYYIWA